MRKIFCGISIILFVTIMCANTQGFEITPEQAAYKPSPIPDRILLTWDGDPSVSQAVTWRTDLTVENPVAQIAVAEDGPYMEENARIIEAFSTELETNLWVSKYHSVTFKDLQPNTLYAYRVGDGENWSEWFHFRTASANPEPFTFLYFGCIQNDIKEHGSRVIREAFRHAPDARFAVFAGDLVLGGRDDKLWGEFFGIGGWLYSMIPMIPTPGNTEYRNKILTPHWRAQFTLPLNGIVGLEESNYYIDYQGVRVIALNSNRMQNDQAGWLEQVLENNSNRWTIVTYHHPFYTLRAEREDFKYLERHWKPVFEKFGVDLALNAHDHAYARNHIDGNAVHVVSVAGGKMREVERQPWMARAGDHMQFFQVIRVDGDKLFYEARTATGELYDAFELHKQADNTNKLTDRIPSDIPERIRALSE